jgi:diguanylate cyclase (GGDEF)-like protein/PAS domain S-box-containing protein
MNNPADPNLLRTLFEAAPEGIMICDALAEDYPIVYVNRAAEQLTGYGRAELVGKNPRLLYATDRDQDGLGRIRIALSEGVGCRVTVRNFRRDGTLFFNDITLTPLRDDQGRITHYSSFHRDAGTPSRANGAELKDSALSTQTMLAYVRDDKLTGLLRRSYFEDLLQRDWGLAQRESRRLTLVAFDLDFFTQYREVFGAQGGDQCFRRIARVIAGCFRRATDLCARFDDDQVVALTVGMEGVDAVRFVEGILQRVRDLAIHHPRSSVSRYVTVSAGLASVTPGPDATKDNLIGATLGALRRAKELGRNRVVNAS